MALESDDLDLPLVLYARALIDLGRYSDATKVIMAAFHVDSLREALDLNAKAAWNQENEDKVPPVVADRRHKESELLMLWSRCLLAVGKSEEALDAINAAMRDRNTGIVTGDFRFFLVQAMCLLRMAKWTEAEQAAITILQLPQSEHVRGYALFLAILACVPVMGRGEQALAYGKQAMADDPKDPMARAAYAIGLAAVNRSEEARKTWEGLVEIAPNQPALLDGFELIHELDVIHDQNSIGESVMSVMTIDILPRDQDYLKAIGQVGRSDWSPAIIAGSLICGFSSLGMGFAGLPVFSLLWIVGVIAYLAYMLRRGRQVKRLNPAARSVLSEIDQRRDVRVGAAMTVIFAILVAMWVIA